MALADAQKGISMFSQGQISVPIAGVIENMAYFTPEELPDNKYYIFGQNGGKNLADKNGVDFLGEIPIVQSIREAGDNGRPVILNEDVTSESFEKVAQKFIEKINDLNDKGIKANVVQVS